VKHNAGTSLNSQNQEDNAIGGRKWYKTRGEPLFSPGRTNKEGILANYFRNIVFLEVTINVPPKVVDFLGMALKWSLLQFTEWWNQAHEDLCEMVSLILLFYICSSVIEPEPVRDVMKHLTGTANTISKYVYNFGPNNKAFSKGDSYQMYCKIWVGTNLFSKALQQMIEDLKGVSNKVLVFKSVLQCSNTQVVAWISTSHCNLDQDWLSLWVAQNCVTLKAGTCNHTLPDLDKTMFLEREREVLEIGFQWRKIYNGSSRSEKEKAKEKPLYMVHVISTKQDCQLACSLLQSLFVCPSFLQQTLMEYCLAPTFSSDNSPAPEQAKFLESLKTHKYVQDKLKSWVIPDLKSLDLRAKLSTKPSTISVDDLATAVAKKKNPTACQLLMKLSKKGMPGILLFINVGSNW
jgi:hypothetical protein